MMRALVVGDLMNDVYVEGSIHRISPEAPVPIMSIEGEWSRPGGAANVAASLGGLGCRVAVAGVVGRDDEASSLRAALGEFNIEGMLLVESADLRTISKTRFVAAQGRYQVLRLDRDGDRSAFRGASAQLERLALPAVAESDVVVLSDYDKGTLAEDLASRLVARCREREIPCVVDTKKSDFSIYAGATILTPNVHEATRALGTPPGDFDALVTAAVEARRSLRLDHLLITRGPDGMTLVSDDGVSHFPAEVREVADVTGAGDTVTAVVAASLGSGRDIKESCRLAGIAAGIAVGHRGCYIVKASDLEGVLNGRSPKILDRDSAPAWVDMKRRQGRRVVFTNGCFDILHAGHLSSLEQARRFGDLLIVGLNSDVSVRLNKGTSRPIIPAEQRAALLAGLSCVDAVVLFEELTPEELIRELAPDVLVKGADYAGRPIAGAEFVVSRGGQVVTIPLVDGLSTTRILNSLGAGRDLP